MTKRSLVFIVVSIALLSIAFPSRVEAQSFEVGVRPGVLLPVLGSKDLFSLGAAADLNLDWRAFGKSAFIFNGTAGYSILPVNETAKALSICDVGLGAGLSFQPFDAFRFRLVGRSGYYRSFFDGDSGGSFFGAVDADAKLILSPALSLGLGVDFRGYFTNPDPLLLAFGATFGMTVSFGARETLPSRLDLPSVEFLPLFPVFRTYFDTHSFGKINLRNGLPGNVEAVKVTFYMKGYMDAPKTCAEIAVMKPGETRSVDVYALLNDSILGITEETKIQGTISVEYLYRGKTSTVERIESVRVYDRNAMTWEDDRRAASFVTAKDPTVLRFAKAINAVVRDDPSTAGSLNFRIALGLFEELGLYGVRYTVSPTGSYAETSADRFAVDFLQFPRQTLEYKGGDCSDLSILYAALLESIGIETAFITVPGHIFLAFAPGLSPDEAASVFSHAEDLIVIDGKVWVPVEITLVKNGFLAAWKEGSREWRENVATRAFYPLHEAWSVYGPVALPGTALDLGGLGGADFLSRYQNVMRSFAEREVAAREDALKAEIERTDSSPASLNKLGVLYARYGLFDKARAQFEAAAAAGGLPSVPALINLGNLAFLRGDWTGARAKYETASTIDPASWAALLGLAKAAYETEDYAAARACYEKAVAMRPELAAKYAFLAERSGSTTRASAAEDRAMVEWSDK
jgi:hypothetical protein